jgi:hypothetical protein
VDNFSGFNDNDVIQLTPLISFQGYLSLIIYAKICKHGCLCTQTLLPLLSTRPCWGGWGADKAWVPLRLPYFKARKKSFDLLKLQSIKFEGNDRLMEAENAYKTYRYCKNPIRP